MAKEDRQKKSAHEEARATENEPSSLTGGKMDSLLGGVFDAHTRRAAERFARGDER
jgi:hypothetical protein